ncbi:S46 family peptidase [Luteolibacter flavescens]|uniref:Dipeptidyl-peptidase n=1 Tax=Luteolibacter flavescens TaxID=1859460 RepID=A0ABT3FNZ2_9BACT|nr:S46 family peptidase [Luteolibacter flavescens]MCW1885296.1 S46 family peptidase [Luteolibacter flavescens]
MRPFLIPSLVMAALLPVARADEGMWLFTKPPVRQVKEKYGFEITPQWLEHLQKSSVRFGNGGSGSFVSANGLILTNHHVGSGMIEKLSTKERDLLKNGFYAATAGEELKCPDLELNVLVSIEDVTARVTAAVKDGQSPDEAAAARRAVTADIQKKSYEATGLRSDVVTLYQGGAYHLYRYHRYTDVRLVFAPDVMAAAFGGDPDNFEFPRYCLDFCFFRAYENDAPAKTPHFLKWKTAGAQENELVFTSGHPGRTNRSVTLAQLESMRDSGFPHRLEQIFRGETLLRAWSDRDRENARRAKGAIVGTQNGRKATMARLNGLLDPALMARKKESEAKLRETAEEAFTRIEHAEKASREYEMRLRMLEGGDGFGSGLFGIARTLLRVADESAKPEGERLGEYRQASRPSLELDLLSTEPVYKDMETLRMANALTFLCAKLGATDATVQSILAGKSPDARATELIQGTTLDDVEVRRKLYEGGKEAVAASADPLILLAKLVDEEARGLRLRADATGEVISQAHREIATARFARDGDSAYPDATFSLRLSYGVVKGYMDGNVTIPPHTTFWEMHERHANQGAIAPFDLTEAWKERATKLDPLVPLNFISTNDITGGNSGSPVVNREGELVGLIFDSNAPGLVSDFFYTEEKGRAVSVHPAAIQEVMKKIYRADRVLEELTH